MAPTAIPLANTLLPGRLSGACLLSFGLLSPLAACADLIADSQVTPLAGVWIETGRCGQNHPDWSRVTLWIETTSSPASNRNSKPSRPLRPGG